MTNIIWSSRTHIFKNVTPLLISVLAKMCWGAGINRSISVTMCVKCNTVLEVSHCMVHVFHAMSGNFDDMKILLSRHGGHLLNSWSNCNSITWYKFAINCEPLWLSMVSDKSHASKMHAWLDILECNSANRRVYENHFKGIVKPNRSNNFLWNNGKILMCYEDVSMCLKPWTRS